jgi:diguanylate cyclase
MTMQSKTNVAIAARQDSYDSEIRQPTTVKQRSSTQHHPPRGYRREATPTFPIADDALGRIKALNLPADPPSFEIFYNYVGAYNPELNRSINKTLAEKGLLLVEDIDQIYDTYFSSTRIRDSIDGVGQKLNVEIDEIAAMLKAAVNSATVSRRHFADVGQRLNKPLDNASLVSIVEGLILATKKVEDENSILETRLRVSQHQVETLQQNLTAIRSETFTDPLTQIANRKGFDRALEKGISKSRQDGKPLSLLLTDIDHFKKFNDTHGHLVGDSVLRLVGTLLKQSIRSQDTAARYGGEEFAVILPRTALSDATRIAENIRSAVMTKVLKKRGSGDSLGRVTISMGVAQLALNDVTETLIERADKCLYAAKRNGRNQVVSERDDNDDKVEK